MSALLRRSTRHSPNSASNHSRNSLPKTLAKRKAPHPTSSSASDNDPHTAPKKPRPASHSPHSPLSIPPESPEEPSIRSSPHEFVPRSASSPNKARGRGRSSLRGSARARKPASAQNNSRPKPHAPSKPRPIPTTDTAEHEGSPRPAQGEYTIAQDNDLFNTIRTGSSAIGPPLEDWIDLYTRDGDGEQAEHVKGEAIALFINFVLRCCGCNSSITMHEALDFDGATETLDTIQEAFKLVPSRAYPLIAKTGKCAGKPFRKNLISLVVQLVQHAHASGALYDAKLIPAIQAFLVSMSSSTLRSFRHTSTLICLFGFVSSLGSILAGVKKELVILNRKVEVESNKLGSLNGTTSTSSHKSQKSEKLKEWEKRQRKVHYQKRALEEYISEFFDGVFVHRYRDADPNIRVDCVQALGHWMKTVPDYFLDGNYLRYIGWVLTDSNKDARNEALRALSALYAKEEHIGAMQHFTTRFRARLVEMATGETDNVSRCLSITILTLIDRHGLLESAQRNQLGRLIYHEDRRVRKAASPFFGNLFDEALDARRIRLDAATGHQTKTKGAGTGAGAKTKQRAEEAEKQLAFKCLAHLLLKLGREPRTEASTLQKGASDSDASSSEGDSIDGRSSTDGRLKSHSALFPVSVLSAHTYPEKGRIDLAVEDLWAGMGMLHDWQGLCQYLLHDHTATAPGAGGRRGESSTGQSEAGEAMVVDKACKLSESEETMLVEVLVGSLRKFGSTATAEEEAQARQRRKRQAGKAGGGATDESGAESGREVEGEVGPEGGANRREMTRVMVDVAPKLWAKYSTDPVRLREVFRIPKLMVLNMYLDLRMISAFEEMWETLTREYLKQQEPETIQVLSSTIVHVLSESKSLEHVSMQKASKLYEALVTSLCELELELETGVIGEDERVRVGLVLGKLAALVRQVDLTRALQRQRGSGDRSGVEVVTGIAVRGRLANREEAQLVELALEILQLNFTWTSASACQIIAGAEASSERAGAGLESTVERALGFRDALVGLLVEYAISPGSGADGSVKRAAFVHLLNTHLLCQGRFMPDGLRMECDEQTQYRCAGFVEAEIEKFVGEEGEAGGGDGVQGGEEDVLQEEEEEGGRGKRKKGGTGKGKVVSLTKPLPSLDQLGRIELFDLLITTFAKAIRCGLIHFRHASVLLGHYGRISKIYDLASDLVVGCLGECVGDGEVEAKVVVKSLGDGLKECFQQYLNEGSESEERFIKLARVLQPVIIERGARMKFKLRLDSGLLVGLHVELIKWLITKAAEPDIEMGVKRRMGTFFKGLVVLVIGIDGRGALRIKSETDRVIKELEFVVPSAKGWDCYQMYIKRLISVMAKDPSVKRAAKMALQKQSDAEAEEEGGETEREAGGSRKRVVGGGEGQVGQELRPAKRARGAVRRTGRVGRSSPRASSVVSVVVPRNKKGKPSGTVRGGGQGLPGSLARSQGGGSSSAHASRASSVVSVVIPVGGRGRSGVGVSRSVVGRRSNGGESSQRRTQSMHRSEESGSKSRSGSRSGSGSRSDGASEDESRSEGSEISLAQVKRNQQARGGRRGGGGVKK